MGPFISFVAETTKTRSFFDGYIFLIFSFYSRHLIYVVDSYRKFHVPVLVSRARPFTDSCPPGRKSLVPCVHTSGDFPHDSWGTVPPRVLLIGSCVFFKLP